MRRLFSWSIRIVGGLLALVVVVVTVCMIVGVKLDLSFLRPGVEAAAQSALGREVKIQGPVLFEFSSWPAIQVRDVQIANVPRAVRPEFLKAGLVRLQIGLFSLLKGEIVIGDLTAEDVALNLENDAQGQPNWVFGSQAQKKPRPAKSGDVPGKPKKAKKPSARPKDQWIRFGGLNKLSLKKIAVTYHDAALGKSLEFRLDAMSGHAPPGKPIVFDLSGRVLQKRFDLYLKGGSIDDLLAKTEPWAFTLAGKVAGKQVRAKGDMTVRNQQPEISLAFGIRDVDVGAILAALGIVKGLEASVGDAAIEFSINGESLKQVLEQSRMAFVVKDAKWKVDIPNTRARIDITNLSGGIHVERGKSLTMELTGDIKQTPVKLRVSSAPLVAFVSRPDEVPLSIDAEMAGMRLHFSSRLALPITSRDLKLALKISGERLNSLDDLFALHLPPVGPFALDTRLSVSRQGYDLSRLNIEVGKSRLRGRMKLDTSGDKPKLDVSLVSDLIRLEDFERGKSRPADGPSAAGTPPPKHPRAEKTTAPGTNGSPPAGKRRNLLSHEVLSRLDAEITVQARQVISGKDRLGSASVKVSLKDSRLAVAPLRVDVPGGGVQVGFDYRPTANDITANLKANIEKFDLGIMFRRARPGTDMGGIFSLDAALHSTAPDIKHIMENAGGHFDFALAPKNFSAGIIDLWAVNLLSAIISKTSETEKSKINCFVARFSLRDGLMKEKTIYMDTSNMRIAGTARINFKTRKLDIVLVPKAKQPEFFSLAVPIKVAGTFNDFNLGIGAGKLAGSIFSFITSPIHVPVRRLFTQKAPASGRDVCMAAWTQAGGKQPKPGKAAKP